MIVETETIRDTEARKARLAEAWALRDAVLAAGLETWDAERIAAEVRKIRDGEEP